MKAQEKYWILSYYCYTQIEDPEEFREEHHQFCLDLNLRGRIIISQEGLNGIVSGLKNACQTYINAIKKNKSFAHTNFKIEKHHDHTFRKLNVRYKPEIVHSDLIYIDPNKKTGIHLKPRDFKQMKDQKDVVLLDVRSNHEHQLGKFKDALTLNINYFREFYKKIDILEEYKNKKIITYCTGGIKCEKASAFLLENGFKEVYQLEGGIIQYGIETGGEDFQGDCYVFDNRIKVKINKVNPSVISRCYVCNQISDHMVNCANVDCNRHTIICRECMQDMEGTCSQKCKQAPTKRSYNMKGYYASTLNGYNPYRGSKRKRKSKFL